jgi:hypothetical protein
LNIGTVDWNDLPDDGTENMTNLVEVLFQDAGVRYKHNICRGDGYSITEEVVTHYPEIKFEKF